LANFELKVKSTAPALASVIAWISRFELAAFEVSEVGVRVSTRAKTDKKARRVRILKAHPSKNQNKNDG
jgi:hypothetical protein